MKFRMNKATTYVYLERKTFITNIVNSIFAISAYLTLYPRSFFILFFIYYIFPITAVPYLGLLSYYVHLISVAVLYNSYDSFQHAILRSKETVLLANMEM